MKRKKTPNPNWVPAKDGDVVGSGVDFGKGLTYKDTIDHKNNSMRRDWSNGMTEIFSFAPEPTRFSETFVPIVHKRPTTSTKK